MHRLTDKKFSLREKIMATFMFILSAVLVFIINKTNSSSALGVNSYRLIVDKIKIFVILNHA